MPTLNKIFSEKNAKLKNFHARQPLKNATFPKSGTEKCHLAALPDEIGWDHKKLR